VEGAAYHDSSASRTALVPRDLTSVTGLAVCWLTTTPFGLLAPIGALYLYAEGRAVLLLRAALAIAFIGTAIAACSYADPRHDLLLSWVAFFAVALCVGESVAAKASGSLRTDAVQAMRIIESMPAHTWSASPDGHITYVSASTLSYIGQLADKPGLFHILDNAGWASRHTSRRLSAGWKNGDIH
jgi:hypothetical protein